MADIVAKVFLGGERKFLEPLMRFMRDDVRDHIVSSKIDHGPPGLLDIFAGVGYLITAPPSAIVGD